MTNLIKKIAFIATLSLTVITPSLQATEIHVWDKKPIEIRLEVGKERLVHFSDNVMLEAPQEVVDKVQVYSAAGTLYLKPKQQLGKTRAWAVLNSGEKIFLDIFAVRPKDEELDDIKIIHSDEMAQTKEVFGLSTPVATGVTVQQLVQYASIDLYGVQRLVPQLPVVESEVTGELDFTVLFGGGSAAMFDVKPLKQYRTANYTLTALLITNRTQWPQQVIYTDVFPAHIAVSSQHIDVGPVNSITESTTLYMVTDRPLRENSVFAVTTAELMGESEGDS
ncbi:DUF3438 family protein [Photobacterium lutimaris]|nr:DUF3438 family protein [Photobacterium lutimaris]TDR72550.1 integrating conjugative element protein (TIGR03749 family) [Photobacterium lutimaris]